MATKKNETKGTFKIDTFIKDLKKNEENEYLISREQINELSEKLGDKFLQNKKDLKSYKYEEIKFRYYQFHRTLNQSKKVYSELNTTHNFRAKITIHNDKKSNKYELWIARDRKRIKCLQSDDLKWLKGEMDKMVKSKVDLIEKFSKEKAEKKAEKVG